MISTVLVVVLLLVFAFFAFVLAQYVMRENRVGRVRTIGSPDGRLSAGNEQFRETFQLLTATKLYPGNEVEVLFNGSETYPRLFDDLRAAKELITWHVFWLRPGRLADELADILIERAKSGVKIFFLMDAFGSKGFTDDYGARLRAAGIEVAVFRPFHWRLLYKVQQRSHVRAVLIDGRVGWTGGFGIDDRWDGDGRHPGQWRDTNVRVRGPAVDQLQASFVAAWAETMGEMLVGGGLFHADDEPEGDVTCGLVYTQPALGTTQGERYFVLSISAAQERLWITSPYFIPDDDFRELLYAAAERGVDVRILTPGANNDKTSVMYASRSHYRQLVEKGIRIWEYEPTMVHAKTLVADSVWFSVGTINFDNRSVMLNDEVTLVGWDERIGATLEQAFAGDLEHAREVTVEEVARYSLMERVKQRFYRTFSAVL
ncbi:MAG: phospholipase D-like domain-containing protein [Thermoanaerobaculia bacterium]